MRELLIATGNRGKFREISEALGELPFKLVSLHELGLDSGGFEEDGETFADNALIKAKYFADKTGMITVGEDSGLFVKALEGELGVKTRRWGAGAGASDEEWIEYFLERMEGEGDRSAKFVSCACLLDKHAQVEEFFEGETRGVITESLRMPVQEGLPLSSCFVAEGFEEVYAALSREMKNEISHRGKAIAGLKEFLREIV